MIKFTLKFTLYLLLVLWILHETTPKAHAEVEIDNLIGAITISHGVSELNKTKMGYRSGITVGFLSTKIFEIKLRADFSYVEFQDIYVNKTHYYVSYQRIPIFLGSRLQFRLSGVFRPYIEAGLEVSFDRIISPSQIISAPFGNVYSPNNIFFPRAGDPVLNPQPPPAVAGLGSLAALGQIVYAPRGLVNPGSIVNKIHFGLPAGGGFNIYLGSLILGFSFRYHLTRQSYITFTPYLGIRI